METQFDSDKKLVALALLAALGVVLHRLEAVLPLPSPWIKPGLANIAALAALVFFGAREALTVTVVRVFLGSILGGTFLGPTFLLSLAGGVAGTAVMALVYWKGRRAFSLVGVSVAGAYAHTLAIVLCVYFFLIQQRVFFDLLPLFFSFALISGIFTGAAANTLARQLAKKGVSPG